MALEQIMQQAVSALEAAGQQGLAGQLKQAASQSLAMMRDEMESLRLSNNGLRQEVGELNSRITGMIQRYGFDPGQIRFEDGLYWIESDPLRSDATRTAICQRCWQYEKRVMRHAIVTIDGEKGFKCQGCGTVNKLFREPANRP